MILQAKNAQTIQWTLTDDQTPPQPVTGALVKATLFAGRSSGNPNVTTGIPTAPIINVTLVEVGVLAPGVYQALIPGTLNPPQNGVGYTLVVDATIASAQVYHAEEPVYVVLDSSPLDLVTVSQVKDWLGIPTTNESSDNTIQFLITGFSQYVVNQTGIQSFNSVQQYDEILDGNGRGRMFVNNPPIQSIVSLNIGGVAVPPSSGPTIPGYYIEQQKRSIAFRSSGWSLAPPQSIFPYLFISGQGNVELVYNGGYITTPFDLAVSAMKAVSIYYQRKDYQDLASKTLSTGNGTGTIAYRQWTLAGMSGMNLPAEIMDVVSFYSRYARP